MNPRFVVNYFQNDRPSHGHRSSPHSIRKVLYYQSTNVKEEKRHGSIPFFTCQCRCSCASCWCTPCCQLAREITQFCSLGILLYSPSPFLFCICPYLSLSRHIYQRLMSLRGQSTGLYTALQIIDKIVAECDCVTGLRTTRS